MKALFSFVRRPFDSDQITIVRSLALLRLTIVVLTTAILSVLQFEYSLSNYAYLTGICLLSASLWSIFVLGQTPLAQAKNAILREIAIDFVWVFAVVLLTGRSANPFIYYYLVLTAVCAAVLPARLAWCFCLAGIVIYSGLLTLDAREHFAHFSTDYRLHLFGMWVNYVGSTIVTCFFVTRLMKVLRDQHAQLAETREENLKSEQLIGLATVAASTVHTLATPLSTLTMLVDDIVESRGMADSEGSDAILMREQITRCRATMKELSTLAQRGAEASKMYVVDLVSALRDHYSLHHPDCVPTIHADVPEGRAIRCNALFQYAIINLINNAIESASRAPLVKVTDADGELTITIANDSELAPESILQRWGKATRSEKTSGLGIGSLLANSTIEKQGGSVRLDTFPGARVAARTHIVVSIFFPIFRL